jgi:ATP-binding cassette subfamily B protein
VFAGHGMMWGSQFSPDRPKMQRKVDWRRVLALFRPYWWEQSLVFGCIVIAALLGLIPGFMTARIIDVAIPQKNFRELAIDVGIILGTALVSMGFGVAQGWMNSLVGEGIMRDIRTRLVAHLHRMPLSFFTGTKTGEIMNRVSNDVDNVDNVVTGTLTTIITNVVMILTTVVAMFVWNWRLALISMIVVPFMILPLGPVGRRMYDIRKKTREQRDTIESITQETLSISGITLIKSFARAAYARARF